MVQTLYSHALRILTCARCGAPLEASAAGGEFTCGYCNAVSRFARRDESADLSAADAGRAAAISESERYARLRQQDLSPSPLPPAVGALLEGGHLVPARVGEAEAAWRAARSEIALTSSFPVCERLFHLTVLLAPHFDERRRRAALETAIDLLPDAGHRHVLRCMLAREAAKARDFAAAEAWLAPVNPRPTDLEQDTAFRLAAATLASARGEHAKVAELLGFRRDDVPLENRDEVACWILRLDALEHLGREAEATSEMNELVERWGVDRVRYAIESQRPLELCVRSFAAASARAGAEAHEQARARLDARIRAAEERIEALDPPLKRLLSQLAIGTGIITILLGTSWTCAVSAIAELDPLFGAHAGALCPRLCDDCVPPYRFASWTTTTNGNKQSSTLNVYCSDRGGRMTSLADNVLTLEAIGEHAWLERYEVSGGIWLIGLTMHVVFAPIALAITVPLKVRGALRRREQRRRAAAELDRMREERAQL